MRPVTRIAIPLVLVLASPGVATAFSLDEAVRLTLEKNLTLKDALLKKAATEEKVSEVVAGAFPQLSLSNSSIAFNMLDSSGMSSLALMGMGGMGGMGGLGGLGGLSGLGGGGSMSMMQNSVSLTQVLFDGFRTRDGLALAEIGRKSADWDVFNARQSALSDMANAYLNTLRMDGLLQVALAGEKAAKGHLNQALSRQKAGVGTRFEVLQAQTQLANVRGQVSKTRNGATLSKLALFNTINIPMRTDSLETVAPLATVGFELSRMKLAVQNRPELKQLALKKEVDQKTLDLNQRAYLPTVAGMGNYSMQGAGTGRYWMVGLTTQWNLFDGGKTRAKVNQSKLDLARDEALIEQTRSMLALDVEKSLRDRDEAKERLQIADEGLSFAKESVRLAESRYQSGMGTSLEVIDAQSALTQSEQNRIGAYYDLQSTELKLAKALGLDLCDYLKNKKGTI